MNKLDEVEKKANEIILKFKNDQKIDKTWKFQWNQRKSSLALCDFGNRTIQLSIYHAKLSNMEEVNDSILHEIAHAIAGPEAGHGPKWKNVCLQVGARPVRCGKSVENMPCKYKGVCPVCNHVYRAQRKLLDMNKRLCSKRECTARKTNTYIIWSNGSL